MKPKIMLIGRMDANDYTGSRTLYLHRAFSEAGLKTYVYDMNGNNDPPTGCTHSIFLPWVQTVSKAWMQFMRAHSDHPILYTDNFHWYDDCRKRLFESSQQDMDSFFDTLAFASSENLRWWPKDRCEYWGACCDEEIAVPKESEDYIYVDEIWPREWSDGKWTAKDVIDKAVHEIKEKTGLRIASQKTKDGSTANWVDIPIDANIDVERMLAVLAKSRAFIVAHEEALGWMQIEALMCGVPVVTNTLFSKAEIHRAGDGAVFTWKWDEESPSIENAAAEMVSAVCASINADKQKIRDRAVELYGKAAFVKRTGLGYLA